MANSLWSQFQAESERIQVQFEDTVQKATADQYAHPGEKRRRIDDAEAKRRQQVDELKSRASLARDAELDRIETRARVGVAREAKRMRETLGDQVYANQIVSELEGLTSKEIADRLYWAPKGFDEALIRLAGKRIVATRAKESPSSEHMTALSQLTTEVPEEVEARDALAELGSWNVAALDQVTEAQRISGKYNVGVGDLGVTTADAAHRMVSDPRPPEEAQPVGANAVAE